MDVQHRPRHEQQMSGRHPYRDAFGGRLGFRYRLQLRELTTEQQIVAGVREGNSDQQVKNFLVERYGDFVLYRPEIKPMTWLLWFGPFVLLLGAVAGLGWYLRQRRQQADTAPALSDAERARVDQWLKD